MINCQHTVESIRRLWRLDSQFDLYSESGWQFGRSPRETTKQMRPGLNNSISLALMHQHVLRLEQLKTSDSIAPKLTSHHSQIPLSILLFWGSFLSGSINFQTIYLVLKAPASVTKIRKAIRQSSLLDPDNGAIVGTGSNGLLASTVESIRRLGRLDSQFDLYSGPGWQFRRLRNNETDEALSNQSAWHWCISTFLPLRTAQNKRFYCPKLTSASLDNTIIDPSALGGSFLSGSINFKTIYRS